VKNSEGLSTYFYNKHDTACEKKFYPKTVRPFWDKGGQQMCGGKMTMHVMLHSQKSI
jgi:hypothetical protein